MFSALLISALLSQTAPSLGQGRAHVDALRKTDCTKLWAKSGKAAGQHFKSLQALQKFAGALRSYGAETKLESEGMTEHDGAFVYSRVMAVSNWARGLTLERVTDLPGPRNKLKVTMWLARDPRMLIAGTAEKEIA